MLLQLHPAQLLPVPEPASLALMLCGMACIGLRMHRQSAGKA